MKTVLVGLVVVFGLGLVVVLILSAGFSREIARVEARLASVAPGTQRTDLPPAIRAFAERGLAGGRPGVAVRLTQAAEMRLKRGATWTRLPARQISSLPVPGFAWVAEMKLGPLTAVRVIDRFVDGEGRLEVRALGAFRIGAETGADAALGEGLRYVSELPWTPDAILVNRAIVWEETPEGITARMETEGGPAEILFQLDAFGDIAGVRAEGRPAKLADGTPARLVWRGWFKDYAEIGGRRIPLWGEVGYEYPEGFETYFRGRITDYEVIAE